MAARKGEGGSAAPVWCAMRMTTPPLAVMRDASLTHNIGEDGACVRMD